MSHLATAVPRPKSTNNRQPASKPRRISREQLLRSLKIIGTIPAPLPPELPPSPPASRSASPAPHNRTGHGLVNGLGTTVASSSKRKMDGSDTDSVKRSKTKHGATISNASSSSSSASVPLRSTPSHKQADASAALSALSPSSSRGDDTAATPNPSLTQHLQTPSSSALSIAVAVASSSSSLVSSAHPPNTPTTSTAPIAAVAAGGSLIAALPTFHMPVRRPRRGKGSVQDFDRIHAQYHALGRKFKYSGEARFWSTYPSSHKHFKALYNPPAPGTPYHASGGLMSRLELTEALVCFVYAIWCQEYPRNKCESASWESIKGFLDWCRTKWTLEHPMGVREMAFVGLILMIEAFITQRRVQYAASGSTQQKVSSILKSIRPSEDQQRNQLLAQQHQQQQARNGNLGSGAQVLPPGMLPSPAGTGSANSTPQNPGNGTPDTNGGGSSSHRRSPSVVPNVVVASASSHGHSSATTNAPTPSHPPPSVSIPSHLLHDLHSVLSASARAALCMKTAQQSLSLPALREHFPRTFGRMVYSTLGAGDEHEPDIEDEDGELFWPGQCVTGEGLGWVCLMGRAMVKEFGADVGYRGVEGLVEKPGGLR